MIMLIIWEAAWIFCLWWDHSKPLWVVINVALIAIPFILAICDIAKNGGSNLGKMDSAILESDSERDAEDDSCRAMCFVLDNEENKRHHKNGDK